MLRHDWFQFSPHFLDGKTITITKNEFTVKGVTNCFFKIQNPFIPLHVYHLHMW